MSMGVVLTSTVTVTGSTAVRYVPSEYGTTFISLL